MKKKLIAVFALSAVAALAMVAGCSPSTDAETEGEASSTETTVAAEGSLVAYHEGIGQDISNISEVSFATCEPCHGDYDEIVSETEDMWAGIGQITDANPHASHATNAVACEDCHTLTAGAQVNICNQCHEFESPQGWEDMSSQTTTYGTMGTEAPYDTYRDLETSIK